MKLKENIPDTELKLILNSQAALTEDGKPGKELNTLFQFGDEPSTHDIWYLETSAQDLNHLDWSVRYRLFGDGGGLELTFKKRYSETEYKDMLNSEAAKQFSAGFLPEIDLTYTKKTYSLSYVRVFSDIEDSPDEAEAKRLAIINSPAVFTDFGGKNAGFVKLCESSLLGPVTAVAYSGEYNGLEAKLEIWQLKGSLAELSFDVPTKKSAQFKKEILKALIENDLLLKKNILKTDAFIEYFCGKKPRPKPDKQSCRQNDLSSLMK